MKGNPTEDTWMVILVGLSRTVIVQWKFDFSLQFPMGGINAVCQMETAPKTYWKEIYATYAGDVNIAFPFLSLVATFEQESRCTVGAIAIPHFLQAALRHSRFPLLSTPMAINNNLSSGK
ncbi:hypothetical protein RJT34_23271 [Clitoria ternatea]|uniref:Uncharacterized protein n=1 Tax=Clitoria ternatea TaxID=43366 RepID=A0AAN9II94_CLITE